VVRRLDREADPSQGSTAALGPWRNAIRLYLNLNNGNARPLVWVKAGDQILANIALRTSETDTSTST
jgi:hypothetical protein